MIFTTANFPISGRKENPTQADYALEAVHLRNEAELAWMRSHDGHAVSQLRSMAHDFDRIARKLSWCPTPTRPTLESAA